MGNIGVEDMGMNEGRKGGWINMFLICTWALDCPVSLYLWMRKVVDITGHLSEAIYLG